jgi:hypothetical protein
MRAGRPLRAWRADARADPSKCGSWWKGLSMLVDAPEADPTRRRLLAHGPRFTRTQALSAVEAFLRDLPVDEAPRLGRYLEWAAGVARDRDGRTRVPCNQQAFMRLFGSWNAVLTGAGEDPVLMHLRSRDGLRASRRRGSRVAAGGLS